MICRLVVTGKAVGKNQAYLSPRRRGAHRGDRILTSVGREWKERVHRIGLAERSTTDWPRDPYLPKRVRVTVRMFGSRHDEGACMQLAKDALEGVFYDNDRVVETGPGAPADPSGKPARVEIDVELLELRSVEEADRLRTEAEKRLRRRLARTPLQRFA